MLAAAGMGGCRFQPRVRVTVRPGEVASALCASHPSDASLSPSPKSTRAAVLPHGGFNVSCPGCGWQEGVTPHQAGRVRVPRGTGGCGDVSGGCGGVSLAPGLRGIWLLSFSATAGRVLRRGWVCWVRGLPCRWEAAALSSPPRARGQWKGSCSSRRHRPRAGAGPGWGWNAAACA